MALATVFILIATSACASNPDPNRQDPSLPTSTVMTSITFNDASWQPDRGVGLLVGSNGTVQLFNGTGTIDIFSGVNVTLTHIAWRPDGSYALIIGDGGTVLTFANVKDGIRIIESGTKVNLKSVAWKPDGAFALIAGDEGVMLKFDHDTQSIFRIPTSVNSGLNKISWNDGEHAEISGENGTVITYTPDEHPRPAVSILEPQDGSTVSEAFTIRGLASVKNDTLSKVDVRIDCGKWLDALGTESWALELDTVSLTNGPHTLHVRAWTLQGISLQVSIAVIVSNVYLPPSVEITSPSEGSEVSGVFDIEGTAVAYSRSLERVDVRLDDYGWEPATGTGSWSLRWDSSTLADGTHVLKVRTWDGMQFTMVSREFRVKNAPAGAPTSGAPVRTGPSQVPSKETPQAPAPHPEPVIFVDKGERVPAPPLPSPGNAPTPSVPAASRPGDGKTIVIQFTPLWTLILIGLAFSTEHGKYALFQFLYVPLYSRIKKDRVLDNFTRGIIYGFIMSNPGVHYNFIKQKLGLNNGSIVYHLTVLERQELIKSERVGLYKRFYPVGRSMSESGLMELNETQEMLLELLKDSPGLTQRELADRTGISARVINYHIGLLQRARLIRLERIGKITKCFATERMPVC